MINFLKFSIFSIFCILFLPCISAEALTVSGQSADVTSTNSNATALVSYASNYDTFYESDYVIWCSNTSEYYIAWGKDFYINGNSICSDKPIELILYYRSTGINSTYQRVYTTSNELRLTVDRVVVSNLPLGQQSELANTYKFRYWNEQLTITILIFTILISFFKLRSRHL